MFNLPKKKMIRRIIFITDNSVTCLPPCRSAKMLRPLGISKENWTSFVGNWAKMRPTPWTWTASVVLATVATNPRDWDWRQIITLLLAKAAFRVPESQVLLKVHTIRIRILYCQQGCLHGFRASRMKTERCFSWHCLHPHQGLQYLLHTQWGKTCSYPSSGIKCLTLFDKKN